MLIAAAVIVGVVMPAVADTLLLSFPDYNVPAADAVARFTSGGLTYYLLRQGLKAQTVLGLVVKTQDGWRALFAPRDYALLF